MARRSEERRVASVGARVAAQAPAALAAIARAVRLGSPRPCAIAALLREGAPAARDALVRIVLDVAFLAHAEARGLAGPGRPLAALHADLRRGATGGWARLAALARALDGGALDGARALAAPDDAVLALLDAVRAVDGADADLAAIDVEDLGAVHEALVGLTVVAAAEPSIAIGPERAPIGLASLVGRSGAARIAAVEEALGRPLGRRARAAIDAAASVDAIARAIDATAAVAPAGAVLVAPTDARRRSGSHYTPRALADAVVDRALAPLVARLGDAPPSRALLAITVCDPAMGSGAFLLAACRWLGDRVAAAWAREGAAPPGDPALAARRAVADRCLFGVDASGLAVAVARRSLWLEVGGGVPLAAFDAHLCEGDALVGAPWPAGAPSPDGPPGFDWPRALAGVFDPARDGGPGFDAMIGNPPWISYAGRAAQPIDPSLRRALAARYASFAGYPNLQGVFVERAASLLRAGGRLAFVLPSSMSEQDGYAPTRRAHDALCAPDDELRDLGEDEFAGVFQPCMVLSSTRLAAARAVAGPARWPVERPDLDAAARRLLAKLDRPPLPPSLFGERGVQTSGDDVRHLASAPSATHTVGLRAGGDVEPFRLAPPSWWADPARLGARLRTPAAWRAVRVLFRQTARVPMAALSDGLAFRNSVLAGFEDDAWPATFLVAYLNATPIRWLHHARHRDARQGMPQLKIGHLRATPAPDPRCVKDLAALGAELSARGAGLGPGDQARIDAIVGDAFDLDRDERARLAAWWAALR